MSLPLDKRKRNPFFAKKEKNLNSRLKNLIFSKPPILKILLLKFWRLVIGLLGLINAKGIDKAQSIWL